MQILRGEGWPVAAYSSTLDLDGVCRAVARVYPDQTLLADTGVDDRERLLHLAGLLRERRMLLVLDNFEDNLEVGGGNCREPAIESAFRTLMRSAYRGRLLVTSRYPLPGCQDWLETLPLPPLSAAQTRKLLCCAWKVWPDWRQVNRPNYCGASAATPGCWNIWTPCFATANHACPLWASTCGVRPRTKGWLRRATTRTWRTAWRQYATGWQPMPSSRRAG